MFNVLPLLQPVPYKSLNFNCSSFDRRFALLKLIRTTPFRPLSPYCAVASPFFRTEMDSIAVGSIDCKSNTSFALGSNSTDLSPTVNTNRGDKSGG